MLELNTNLNCHNCNVLFDEPQIIQPCCHILCKPCLSNLNNINCPSCNFPINFVMPDLDMKELILKYKNNNCTIHFKEFSSKCKTCGIFCCPECQFYHSGHPMKEINEILISQINSLLVCSEKLDNIQIKWDQLYINQTNYINKIFSDYSINDSILKDRILDLIEQPRIKVTLKINGFSLAIQQISGNLSNQINKSQSEKIKRLQTAIDNFMNKSELYKNYLKIHLNEKVIQTINILKNHILTSHWCNCEDINYKCICINNNINNINNNLIKFLNGTTIKSDDINNNYLYNNYYSNSVIPIDTSFITNVSNNPIQIYSAQLPPINNESLPIPIPTSFNFSSFNDSNNLTDHTELVIDQPNRLKIENSKFNFKLIITLFFTFLIIIKIIT